MAKHVCNSEPSWSIMLSQMFISKAVPKTPEVAAPVLAAPVAATTDIDAALEAAKQGTTTEEQLRADSDAIVASWKAKRGFHKRIHGVPFQGWTPELTVFHLSSCCDVSKALPSRPAVPSKLQALFYSDAIDM